MTRQVTADQYVRCLDVLGEWPERLNSGFNPFGGECLVEYLGSRIGVTKAETDTYHGLNKISQHYGIPTNVLRDWPIINDWVYIFRPRRRAKEMKRIFEEFLDDVEVVVPPLEMDTAALQRDLYYTEMPAEEAEASLAE